MGICTGTASKELSEGERRVGSVERGSTGQEGRLQMKFLGDQSGYWMFYTFINDFGIKRQRMLRKFDDDIQLGLIANAERAGISYRKTWMTSRFGVIGTG